MSKAEKFFLSIDSKYFREQFDDWLAGGRIEFKDRVYFWSAYDSNYGFGWEIEPVTEKEWSNISEVEFEEIMSYIRKCLNKHETTYLKYCHVDYVD